jgi:hypothetical protein
MPDISLIPEVKYEPLQPYHWIYDNKPIENLLLSLDSVNAAVEWNTQAITQALGSAGTLAARLNQSLEENGNLKATAIDTALHNIAAHADGSVSMTPSEISLVDPDDTYSLPTIVPFVRMLDAERAKLMLISPGATALKMEFYSDAISSTLLFEDETIEFIDSDTIIWSIESANKIKASMAFPASAAHEHYYDEIPVPAVVPPNYQDYKVNSIATPFVEDSLRIYINGVRLTEGTSVYVPDYSTTPTYTLVTYSSDYASGTFSLDVALTSSDVIRIDYDLSLV